MKKRLKEIEEEAGALREMQAKVEKEMGAVQGLFLSVIWLFNCVTNLNLRSVFVLRVLVLVIILDDFGDLIRASVLLTFLSLTYFVWIYSCSSFIGNIRSIGYWLIGSDRLVENCFYDLAILMSYPLCLCLQYESCFVFFDLPRNWCI